MRFGGSGLWGRLKRCHASVGANAGSASTTSSYYWLIFKKFLIIIHDFFFIYCAYLNGGFEKQNLRGTNQSMNQSMNRSKITNDK